MMETAYLQTPIGTAVLEGDADGLSSIRVLDENVPEGIVPEVLEDAVYQLREYFEGKRKEFDLKLNPSGSEFQKKVWDALLEIPYGRTLSYLELSKRLGNVKEIGRASCRERVEIAGIRI